MFHWTGNGGAGKSRGVPAIGSELLLLIDCDNVNPTQMARIFTLGLPSRRDFDHCLQPFAIAAHFNAPTVVRRAPLCVIGTNGK